MFESILTAAANFFATIWGVVKHIFVLVCNFFKNIVGFFKTPSRLNQLKQNKKLIATSIKQNLENGDYGVVNCLFDTESEKVVDMEESGAIEAEDLDSETRKAFRNKPMIILQ